ncbi:MAG: FAD:protein FMN transferase [Planctomycetota bacterium]|jgi:thiamine biosynthesis lipoprotein
MNQPKKNTSFIKTASDILSSAHHFSHDAMATSFEIFIYYEDFEYARQSAHAAFEMLDYLESELSRYIENSDISRINNLTHNQTLSLSLETFEALQLCLLLYDRTDGAFDISVGPLMKCWLNKDKTLRNPSTAELKTARSIVGLNNIKLNKDDYTVTLLSSRIQLDLGGFGKGFAIDKMAEALKEWSIDTAFINAGSSTVLAIGQPPNAKGWPVTISNPENRSQTLARISLKNRALSGSGLQQAYHIIDPRTGKPVKSKIAAWSFSPQAAVADALSTAFMVMSPDEIKNYCSKHPDVLAMTVQKESKDKTRILHFGSWKPNDLLI